MTDQIDLAGFAPEHLDGATALTRAAGWPHRREDWAMALELGSGFAALDGASVVGAAMVTKYGDAARIGLVVVGAALRGRGLGRRLMALAMREAGDRTIHLSATPDGLPLYEKLGFQAVGELAQYQGILGSVEPGAGVSWAAADAMAEIVALDRIATGMDRSRLIELLFRDGRIATVGRGGYVAVRRFGRGMVAGPIIAASIEQAKALLLFAFAAFPGTFMRVDVPLERGLATFLAGHGLAQVDVGVAMTRPALQTFALASQALG